MYQLILRFWYC